MQSDWKNYFGFLVDEFSGIQAHGRCALWLLDTVYLRPWQTVWSRKNFENTWYFGMYNKLRECFHYKCKITFRIALLFWTNIKYSQHVSMWLSVRIRWTSLTAGHFSLFETVTRGSQIKTLAIYGMHPPLQIHNSLLESLGYSKQTWHLLIRLEAFCGNSINIFYCRCKRKFFKFQAHANFSRIVCANSVISSPCKRT